MGKYFGKHLFGIFVGTVLFLGFAMSVNVSAQETRDPLVHPFSSTSIWNTPIGSEADYIPAGLSDAEHFTLDEDLELIVVPEGSPWRYHRAPGGGTERVRFDTPTLGWTQIGDESLVLAGRGLTPNQITTILQPDGRSLTQLQPGMRPRTGSDVWGYRATEIDLYGEGLYGSHFGSGLPGLGSILRPGELTTEVTIQHALCLELWGERYYYYDDEIRGYRWPANRADWVANDLYGGTNPALTNGSLLAIPPSVTEESLGLETITGSQLYQALRDYGGYICDDSAWDSHQIVAYWGAYEELDNFYERDVWDWAPLVGDINKLFGALHVVDNNAPDTIGGGGEPLVPLLPELSAPPELPSPLDKSGWSATASLDDGVNLAAAALDGDSSTAWRSGSPVSAGDSFTIDFGTSIDFNRMVMNGESRLDEWCWDYMLESSMDGQEWVYVAGGTGYAHTQISFPVQSAQFARISCVGHPAHLRDNWWSIDELDFYFISSIVGEVMPPEQSPIATAASSITAALNPADNLLANPGFEDGTMTPWSGTGSAVVTDDAHTGDQALFLPADGIWIDVLEGFQSNTQYFLQVFAKAEADSQAGVFVESCVPQQQTAVFTHSEFAPVVLSFMTGEDATTCKVGVWLHFGTGYTLDDFSITRNPIANAGFEDGSIEPWAFSEANVPELIETGMSANQFTVYVPDDGIWIEEVTGLRENTHYVLEASVHVDAGNAAELFVEDYSPDGAKLNVRFDNSEWAWVQVPFTTDEDVTSVKIGLWTNVPGSGFYVDDIRIIEVEETSP